MFHWIRRLLFGASQPDTCPYSAEETIATFLKTWSDQKLADVYAFCEDGKMYFYKPCICLLGVASSQVLHTERCEVPHYSRLRAQPGMPDVEMAYRDLSKGARGPGRGGSAQKMRDRRLLKLLSAEMDRRTAGREMAAYNESALIQSGVNESNESNESSANEVRPRASH